MANPSTVILRGKDVASLLSFEDCIAALERAYRLEAEGKTLPSGILGIPARDGGFHVKAGGLELDRTYFAAKLNGNFPRNPERNGLPSIQGVVVLCDASDGRLLAILDSAELTARRTAAATAIAAKHLARSDASVLTLCGCGRQGRSQVEALHVVRPLRKVLAFDESPGRSEAFARDIEERMGIETTPIASLVEGMRASDLCVTCTPSRKAFVTEPLRPGTFLAAVGADSKDKQELDPALFRGVRIVVDDLEQCATIGELHHALDAGVVTRDDVHATLCDTIAGRRPGRVAESEIFVFDSTGVGLQDVAAAAATYERACASGVGLSVTLAE